MMDALDDADALEIERALREDHEGLCHTAHVPDAGLVWWRATIRARADAARIAEHPIAVAHSIAGACVVALACALGALACQEERCAVSYHISSGHRFAVVVRA